MKLTNLEEIHRGFVFKTGLNVDDNRFDDTTYSGDGIYFTTLDNIHHWIDYDVKNVGVMKWMRVVTLPHDAHISYQDKCYSSFKADRVILGERIEIDLQVLVSKRGMLLKYIHNPSDETIVKAVTQDGLAIQFAPQITHNICMIAARQNGLCLPFIPNPPESVCLAAVSQNGFALQFVHNQSLKMCEAAFLQNPYSVICVKYNERCFANMMLCSKIK